MKLFYHHLIQFVIHQEINLFHQDMFQQIHKLVNVNVNLVEYWKINHLIHQIEFLMFLKIENFFKE